MRILPLLLMLAPVAATATPPATRPASVDKAPARCLDREVHYAADSKPGKVRKLGEEPPANQYLAVDRHVDGCRAPIVISTGIGKR